MGTLGQVTKNIVSHCFIIVVIIYRFIYCRSNVVIQMFCVCWDIVILSKYNVDQDLKSDGL